MNSFYQQISCNHNVSAVISCSNNNQDASWPRAWSHTALSNLLSDQKTLFSGQVISEHIFRNSSKEYGSILRL